MPIHLFRLKTACAVSMLAMLVLVAGCSTMRRAKATEYQRTYSYAIKQTTDTTLGRSLASGMASHKGQSGFMLLTNGGESLRTRMSLMKTAEKTIDLQYYTMHDDVTGNLLLKAILDAADRGVRVRFLIDAISMKDVGPALGLMDKNKNIQIRVFNPMSTKDQGPGMIAGIFTDFDRLDKRMHNKVFIIDNQAAIMGGRNLGDEYFDKDKESNFKDLDILSVGPVTAELSESFDAYWNNDESFPVETLRDSKASPEALAELKSHLETSWKKYQEEEKKDPDHVATLTQELKSGKVKLVWATADVAADSPEKIDSEAGPLEKSKPLLSLVKLVDDAEKEFIAISPYFVPRERGVKWLSGIKDKNIDVKILTNSLASTDVVAVYSGYKKYCLDLLKNGIDLYEMKPRGDEPTEQRVLGTTAPPYASLHGKVYIVDSRDVVIGSFNLDPRSVNLNTEVALVIHSPELAGQLKNMFEKAISPKISYKLVNNDGRLAWVTKEKGEILTYHQPPEASVWRRMQSFFMSMLPLDAKL